MTEGARTTESAGTNWNGNCSSCRWPWQLASSSCSSNCRRAWQFYRPSRLRTDSSCRIICKISKKGKQVLGL